MPNYGPFAPAQIDFSPLLQIGSDIGGAISDYQSRSRLQDVVKRATSPDGTVDYAKAFQALLAAGDIKTATALSHMASKTGVSAETVYGNPIWGRTSDGKEGVGVIAKNGKFQLLDTGGFQPERGVSVEDLGYGRGVLSKGSGELKRVIPQTGDLPQGYVPPPNYAPWGPQAAPGGGEVAPPQVPGEMPVYSQPQGPSAGVPGVAPLPSSVEPPPGAGSYMPGSEPAMKAEKEAAAIAEKKRAQTVTRDIVVEDIDRARRQLGASTTGLFGAATANIPGSPAHDLQQMIEGIGANIGFDRLQQMRNQSPTGGALGQVSDFENKLLQSVYGSLRQSQNKGQLDYNLRRLKNIYNKVINEGLKPGDPIPTGEEVRTRIDINGNPL